MRLVIETATPACSVALMADGGALVDERHEVVGRGHAERLLPMITELLAGRVPDAVAVDCGPGSFTGIRVGLAAARALGFAWAVPVTGFSSLALLAAGEAGRVAVAIPGGHGELFVRAFEGGAAATPLASLSPDAAGAIIAERRLIGGGAAALVAARGWGDVVDRLPRAADYGRLPPGERDRPARPIYGRAPDARSPVAP